MPDNTDRNLYTALTLVTEGRDSEAATKLRQVIDNTIDGDPRHETAVDTLAEMGEVTYRVVFRNAISTRGREQHDRGTYDDAMALANDYDAWPWNNTRVNVLYMVDGREVRNVQVCPDPEEERRERERTAAAYRR